MRYNVMIIILIYIKINLKNNKRNFKIKIAFKQIEFDFLLQAMIKIKKGQNLIINPFLQLMIVKKRKKILKFWIKNL